MIRHFTILRIFYLKLLIPSVFISLLLSLQGGFSVSDFGLCFLLTLPLLHYFVYELRLKNEYAFYAHFGFSRPFLWILTGILSITTNLITTFL